MAQIIYRKIIKTTKNIGVPMSKHFDVVIIGGGNAGFGVSSVVFEAGKTVAFIEKEDFGGTCPNRGCTPKKVLVAAGNSLHEIALAKEHCIDIGEIKLNWKNLIKRKNEIISFIPDAMENLAKKRGEVFRGDAKFVNENTVEVNGQKISGDNIVIATGSITRPLPISGAEYMITSTEVLSDDEQPEEVVFVGGGVIAMEFGHLYARAGTKVTVLEVMPQLLPRLDEGAVSALKAESERIGIEFSTNVKVNAIEKTEDKFIVKYEHAGKIMEVKADKVINGSGRIANVSTLNLEAANIKHDGIRVETNEFMQSVSNHKVWLAGDVLTTSPQLSPVATDEGKAVGYNILNGAIKSINYNVLPTSVHTVPPLSSLGLTEEEAKAQDLDVVVKESDMTQWFSGKSYAETVAYAKVIVDKKTDLFVGVHLVGHKGEEIINLFSLAMQFDLTASQVKEANYAYPTFSSDIKNLF
jgi:glutathione reductase (NADPH)